MNNGKKTKSNITDDLKKKKHVGILTVHSVIPLLMMVLILIVVYFFMRGRAVEGNSATVAFLTPEQTSEYFLFSGANEDAQNVIVYSSEDPKGLMFANTVASCMDTLRLDYKIIDICSEKPDYSSVGMMLLCTGNLDDFGTDFESFIKWLNTGNMLWCRIPEYNESCNVIEQMMGIEATDGTYGTANSIKFTGGIIPGLDGRDLKDLEIKDSYLKLSVVEECNVYLEDAATGNPLAWEYDKNGRHISVMNNGLMFEENCLDGLMVHMITKHRDATVWPIMNAKLIYIDDFPAPQPEGYDERLKEQFGYSTQSFFMNVWWPDMKDLLNKYGLKYTGVLIEDYNDNTEPPFERGIAGTLSRYYGADLINEGGEIALHGYNHQSLIPEGYPNEDGYRGWSEQSNMVLATKELLSYASGIFPELTFSTYVPPSNLLAQEGYEAVKEAVPDVRVISGVYYKYQEETTYRTDFFVNEDGIINVPRITSAFIMNDFTVMMEYCALFDQGAFSHFIHPDDVLDEERGALAGWEKMRDSFDESLSDLEKTYPMLRNMTASSGGGAVQRKQQLKPEYSVNKTESGRCLEISLDGFVDEAWLAMCIEDTPEKITGGELYHIADDYYWIRCDSSKISIDLSK